MAKKKLIHNKFQNKINPKDIKTLSNLLITFINIEKNLLNKLDL